jgi:hypothetical protein
MATAGQTFGMSKSATTRYINQVIPVVLTYEKNFLRLPKTDQEWNDIQEGFEAIANLPMCFGAIDGSLIPIERQKSIQAGTVEKVFLNYLIIIQNFS